MTDRTNAERQERWRKGRIARKPLLALAKEFEERAATYEALVEYALAVPGSVSICKATASVYRECARLLTKTLEDQG